jgi:hypothetical protein
MLTENKGNNKIYVRNDIKIIYLFCFCRFANSLSYFGILFATPTLHGNQYLNLGISGLVEIPALIVCVTAINM